MKKPLLTVFALGLLAAWGCKKDDNNNATPGTSLTGNWTMTSYALDSNGDNTLQPSEQRTLETDEYGYLEITNQMIVDSYNIDGVRVTADYTYTRRGDSVFTTVLGEEDLIFVIQKLDATTLHVMQPYSTGTEWYFYNRR